MFMDGCVTVISSLMKSGVSDATNKVKGWCDVVLSMLFHAVNSWGAGWFAFLNSFCCD